MELITAEDKPMDGKCCSFISHIDDEAKNVITKSGDASLYCFKITNRGDIWNLCDRNRNYLNVV
jgi:hypothetical protein